MRERDIAIQECISTFEPVTRQQLEYLARSRKELGAPSKLWRRLLPRKPLIANKHIYYWKAPIGQKYVYSSYDITRRKDFDHDIITSWVQIVLSLFFSVIKFNRPKQKFRGQPNEDGYIILNLPGKIIKDKKTGKERDAQVHYYLESDTGSEPYSQIEDKWDRYIKLLEERDSSFFVLFVCATKDRALRLMERAVKVGLPKEYNNLFLFTYLEALKENPTGRICFVPYKSEKDLFTILPPV